MLGTLVVLIAALAAVAFVPPIRRTLVTNPLLRLYRRILPDMSSTEKEAIDAGTVWWDGDLFSGAPDWNKLLAIAEPRLSDEEQAFVDGPVEMLCAMCDDWEITHERQDLPPPRLIFRINMIALVIENSYLPWGFILIYRVHPLLSDPHIFGTIPSIDFR